MAQAALINDPARWDEFGKLDTELVQMMENGLRPRFTSSKSIATLPESRAEWRKIFRQDADELLKATGGQVTEEEILIPVRDGHELRALVYRQKMAPVSGSALIILLHGGGFRIGNAEMEAAGCISAAQEYGCVSVTLEYRLAPEFKFPVPYEDCWDALKWLSRNAVSLGADLSQGFIFGGSSAGGHIGIPLVHRARDEGLSPPLTGVYLNVTPSLAPQALTEKYRGLYKSRETLKNGLTLTSKSIDMYDALMEPDFTSPLWSPLLWPTGHGNLPPHFFQICGADLLRDEALIYERELRQDNDVKTKIFVYSGMPHVFWYIYPTHSASLQFAKDTTRGLGWLLGQVD